MDRLAGVTSNTVPWEILRAGGFSPRLMEAEPGPTPHADRFMEDVFERRIRVIFDRLCSGAWESLQLVAISRTSEQEHKLYLYLREVSRLGYSSKVPRLYLYNMLHTRSGESYSYGLDRTRQMARDFNAPESKLHETIEESNRARGALREILRLRGDGRLHGSAALALIREFYTTNRSEFADNMKTRIRNLPAVTAGARPRILIKGASLDHTSLHRLVEGAGGYVVAEDDWRGSRAAGEKDISMEGDPIVALFEKYFLDTMSPRIHPPEEADAWFRKQIESGRIDGVLFYVPLQDDVVGWDYPRHLDFLRGRGVPSLLVREDGLPEPAPALLERISGFLDNLNRG